MNFNSRFEKLKQQSTKNFWRFLNFSPEADENLGSSLPLLQFSAHIHHIIYLFTQPTHHHPSPPPPSSPSSSPSLSSCGCGFLDDSNLDSLKTGKLSRNRRLTWVVDVVIFCLWSVSPGLEPRLLWQKEIACLWAFTLCHANSWDVEGKKTLWLCSFLKFEHCVWGKKGSSVKR